VVVESSSKQGSGGRLQPRFSQGRAKQLAGAVGLPPAMRGWYGNSFAAWGCERGECLWATQAQTDQASRRMNCTAELHCCRLLIGPQLT
jgi:hypothetical protein